MESKRRELDVVVEQREMREQMTELRAIIEQQGAQIAALQAQLDGMKSIPDGTSEERVRIAPGGGQKPGRATSRRQLLTSAGAVVAAATVALVASEGQDAHAGPAVDGNSLLLGSGSTQSANNTASTTTTLAAVSGSDAGTLLIVDARASGGTGTTAIYGAASATGSGVAGYSSGGTGVVGTSASAVGEGPFANSGVFGTSSTSGYGVTGISSTGIDLVAGGTGRLQQVQQSVAWPPTTGNYYAGEQIRDAKGDLWLCISGDGTSVGTWAKVPHLVPPASGGVTVYLSKPIRLLDTRSGSTDALTNGGGPYTSGGSPYPVTIAGISFNSVTVPSSCAGAIGNVTVVAGSGGGYLALVPHGVGFSGTANLAYNASQIVSNSFNVGLSGGKLDIIIGGNPTDVILDLFAVVA